jgi:hypothetical protein
MEVSYLFAEEAGVPGSAVNARYTLLYQAIQAPEHKKTTTYDTGNPDPGLGQAQTFGGIKPVNGIPTIHS